MKFDTEKQMKIVAKESLPSVFHDGDFEIVPEFDYGVGRTDIVLANISKPYWDRRVNRLNIDKPITEKNHLIAFLQLHDKRDPVTEEYFYNIGALKTRYKRRALDWLKKNKFVVERDGNKIQTAPNLRRHVTTTIAVELKLRKWRNALKQASRGRSFAEYKYVVIDHSNVDPALNHLDEFKSNNVGLISLDTAGTCHKHYEPDRGDPHSDLYQWKLNETSILAKST